MNLERRNQLNIIYGPDGNLGTATLNGTRYFYFANHAATWRVSADENEFTKDQAITKINVSTTQSQFSYFAAGPVLELPEIGKMVMFYHAEEHPLGRGQRVFYTSIGVAVSDLSDGINFEDLGLVLTLNMGEEDRDKVKIADLGGATFLITQTEPRQLRIYFKDTLKGGEQIKLSVSQVDYLEFVQSIRDRKAPGLKKYYAGGFNENGLGGKSTSIIGPGPYLRWPAVSYNNFLNKYIMVFSQNDPDWRDNRFVHLYFTQSDDGVVWEVPTKLVDMAAELQYPTLVDPTNHQTHLSGQSVNLYFIHSKQTDGFRRWLDAVVMKKRLNFSN